MANKSSNIEKVKWEQLENILKLLDKYLRSLYPETYEEWRTKFQSDFKKGRKVVLGAWYGHDLVGTLIYQRPTINAYPQNTVELKTILVDAEYRLTNLRNLHIGSKLLAKFHYELQRTGYTRSVTEAKYDLFVVPWLINKGYKVINYHYDYGWLSYRLELELPKIYTDDCDDPDLILPRVGEALGIKNLHPITGMTSTFDGVMPLSERLDSSKLKVRIRYCQDLTVLKSFLHEDKKGLHVPVYILKSAPSVPLAPGIRDEVSRAKGIILRTNEVVKLLGSEFPLLSTPPTDTQCLSVLIYPDYFKRMVSLFVGGPFCYVATGWYGKLLGRDSRILFVSNSDFKVLGAAYYHRHKYSNGSEATLALCKDLTIFQKEEFERWANIKTHMTVFECDDLKKMAKGAPVYGERSPHLEKNKLAYYPYERFIEFIKGHLS